MKCHCKTSAGPRFFQATLARDSLGSSFRVKEGRAHLDGKLELEHHQSSAHPREISCSALKKEDAEMPSSSSSQAHRSQYFWSLAIHQSKAASLEQHPVKGQPLWRNIKIHSSRSAPFCTGIPYPFSLGCLNLTAARMPAPRSECKI